MAEAENGNAWPSDLGRSLPAENVQSLATSKNLSETPERYINDCDDGEIPVIDLSRLVEIQHSQDEVMKLGLACERWGFFQVINHGIPGEAIERMRVEMQAFFHLPLEEKKAFAPQPGSLQGYGQTFADWGAMLLFETQPTSARKMELWPSAIRASLDRYSSELKRISDILFESIGKSLGAEEFADAFRECVQAVRMNYCPPCPDATKVLALSPHSDVSGLTLLLQVNQVQGLQIKRNGGWMPINPLPDVLVVNVGDIIEIMSNGKYKSIEHRAVINQGKERMSIAAFHSPIDEMQIGPLAELVKGSKELYRTISMQDLMKSLFSNKLEGKKLIEQMKLRE